MSYILGIDPSIRAPIGYALLNTERNEVVSFGHHTFGRRVSDDLKGRLCQASERITAVLLMYAEFRPAVAIEQQILGRNVQSLTDTSILVGRLTALVEAQGLDWVLVRPAQAKQALTTRGNADKAQMVAMARAHGVVFERETRPQREAIADALGIALAGAVALRGRALRERV